MVITFLTTAAVVLAQVVPAGVSNDTVINAVLSLALFGFVWYVKRDVNDFRSTLHKHSTRFQTHELRIDRLERPHRNSDPPRGRKDDEHAHDPGPDDDAS